MDKLQYDIFSPASCVTSLLLAFNTG